MKRLRYPRILTLILTAAIVCAGLTGVACTQQQEQTPSTKQETSALPPSPQPKGHEGRWAAGGYQADACTSCHGGQEQGSKAPRIPDSHFVNQDRAQGLTGERTPCATCHVEQRGE